MRYRDSETKGIAREKKSSLRRGRPQGITINLIYIDQQVDNNKKNKKESNDTIERKNIHSEIVRLLKYGLGIKDILHILEEKFPNSKYKVFFENWILDAHKKQEKPNISKEDELYR